MQRTVLMAGILVLSIAAGARAGQAPGAPVDGAPPKLALRGAPAAFVPGEGAPDDDHYAQFHRNPGAPGGPGAGPGIGLSSQPGLPGDTTGTGIGLSSQPGLSDPNAPLAGLLGAPGGSEGRRKAKPAGGSEGAREPGGSEAIRDGFSPQAASPFTNSVEFGSEGRAAGGSEAR